MSEILKPTSRRTLLQRGLAVMAGACGLAVVDRKFLQAQAESPPEPVGDDRLRLYCRCAHGHSPVTRPGESPARSHRLVSQGELLDGPDGKTVGEFYSTRFCAESAFGLNPAADSNLELQTFKLKDGTLFGIASPGTGPDGEKMHAVLGGTGRYAGARGTYVASDRPQPGRHCMTEIVLTLKS